MSFFRMVRLPRLFLLLQLFSAVSIHGCGKKPDQTPFRYASPRVTNEDSYIVAGRDAKEDSWPWQVSFQMKVDTGFAHICGAVLIDTDWAITAAHCVEGNENNPGRFQILLGAHDFKNPDEFEQKSAIKQIIKHEDFVMDPAQGYPNDIALLQLSTPAKLDDHVNVACVADSSLGDMSDNDNCWITGWGKTHWTDRGIPDVLQEANVPIPTVKDCQDKFGNGGMILDTHICAGTGKPNSCSGDSGGPMSCKVGDKWYVVGVTSFGTFFCSLLPGVYTRISSYHDWIYSNIKATSP